MTTLPQIERAILRLTDQDFRQLYVWIVERDHQQWDRQIAEDSERGALDELAEQALTEYRQGLTRIL